MKRRKYLFVCILLIGTAQSAYASEKDPLLGTWEKVNRRTVIGTGPMNEKLRIVFYESQTGSGYLVEYTFGSIQKIKYEKKTPGHVFKRTQKTYSRVPLIANKGIYHFIVPESLKKIQFELVKDRLVIMNETKKHEWFFTRIKPKS